MIDQPAFDVRLAGPADVEAIRDLTRAAYAKWVPVIGREPRPMVADYAEAVRRHRFDLLFTETVLAALVETVAKTDHLLIENLAVLPAFQGRGFGRHLLRHTERLAAAQGHAVVRLYTNQRFAENVRFYIRLGYRLDWEEAWADGVIVHMSKSV